MAEQYLSQTQQMRQQMVLAPQLRQSLELLQVPMLELQSLVRQEMDQNPTLEEAPPGEERSEGPDELPDAATPKDEDSPREVQREQEIEPEPEPPVAAEPEKDRTDKNLEEPGQIHEEDFREEFEALAKLDDEWRDTFQSTRVTQSYSAEDAAKRQYFLDSLSQPKSLQQHLMDQLMVAIENEQERQVGELLIGSINDDGFLASPLEELAATTGHTIEELQHSLDLIQEFDPIGVGSRDLRECLLTQLRRLGKEDSLAASIVSTHLDALGARKYPEIARQLKTTVEQVQDAARLIGTLEPKPGRMFTADSTTYVLPEVVVQKVDGDYKITLNNDQIPHLHISAQYRQLMADANTTPEVKNYIRDKIRAGMFLIKSIGQRQQTVFNIAREIVRVQKEFFEEGITHLRPLTMNEIAGVVGIHETTVSRAIANKYIQTPRGTFEMKYFFTPGYKTADGKEISNKTIKDAIQQLVDEEDTSNPLSDQAMVEKLAEQGIKVARRTIAKYREELRILPSHLRKQF